jgi:hypothetical protein
LNPTSRRPDPPGFFVVADIVFAVRSWKGEKRGDFQEKTDTSTLDDSLSLCRAPG